MSEHCGDATHHTKKRGRVRHCEWCGQAIGIGDLYAKWLYFDAGERSTVYAHEECYAAWMEEADYEGGIAYANGGGERPERG